MNSLTYSYVTPNGAEPKPGERELRITVSDGNFPAVTADLIIEVVIFNDNAPQISFGRKSAVTYNETVSGGVALVVGSIMQPVISDADNNDVFLLQGGMVRLIGAVDGSNEKLNISGALPAGINATGMGMSP